MAATMAVATAEAEAAERRWSRKAARRSRLMTRLTDEGQTSGSMAAGRAWDQIPSLRAERDVKEGHERIQKLRGEARRADTCIRRRTHCIA